MFFNMEPTCPYLDNGIIKLDATRVGIFYGCKVTIFLHEKRSLEAVSMRMYDQSDSRIRLVTPVENLVKELVSPAHMVFKRNV